MKVAIAQTRYSKNVRGNIQRALEMVDEAGQNDVKLLVFPEWFVGLNPSEPIPNALTDAFAQAAQRNQLTLVMGSIRTQNSRREKARQVALVLGPDGNLLGQQQKINFYRKERRWFQAGNGVTLIKTPLGRIVVLIGQDALAPDLYAQVQAARPDWLIMQANEQVAEGEPENGRFQRLLGVLGRIFGRQTTPQASTPQEHTAAEILSETVEARSRELSCPVILVCPVGEFYGYHYRGGSLAGVDGSLLAMGPAEEGLTFVQVSPESSL